jgi:hypothetical protein
MARQLVTVCYTIINSYANLKRCFFLCNKYIENITKGFLSQDVLPLRMEVLVPDDVLSGGRSHPRDILSRSFLSQDVVSPRTLFLGRFCLGVK